MCGTEVLRMSHTIERHVYICCPQKSREAFTFDILSTGFYLLCMLCTLHANAITIARNLSLSLSLLVHSLDC